MDNEVLRLIKVITLLYLCGHKTGCSHHIKEEVKHIAKLARLGLTEKEIE